MNVAEIITEKIVAMLDKGTIPWRKPWNCEVNAQRSASTGKVYHGFNQMYLGVINAEAGYESDYWITPAQCKKAGVNFSGAKCETVIYFKLLEREKQLADGTKEKVLIPMMRYFKVLNVSQVADWTEHFPGMVRSDRKQEGYDMASVAADYLRREKINVLASAQAAYSPLNDYITMPDSDTFESDVAYHSTLYHEMVHSTGHPKRLDRAIGKCIAARNSEDYSFEELIAEFGAAYLCGSTGIETDAQLENSAAYIASWRKRLTDNPGWITKAATKAEEAAEYILRA